jgi:hypothetical protein
MAVQNLMTNDFFNKELAPMRCFGSQGPALYYIDKKCQGFH